MCEIWGNDVFCHVTKVFLPLSHVFYYQLLGTDQLRGTQVAPLTVPRDVAR